MSERNQFTHNFIPACQVIEEIDGWRRDIKRKDQPAVWTKDVVSMLDKLEKEVEGIVKLGVFRHDVIYAGGTGVFDNFETCCVDPATV